MIPGTLWENILYLINLFIFTKRPHLMICAAEEEKVEGNHLIPQL